VVICGGESDRAYATRLRTLRSELHLEDRVVLAGFLSDQLKDDVMAAADLVVTKAGSVTIAEAMALGRPLLLHRAVPAQEASNPWLVEWEGVGLHAPRSATLRAAVELLAARPELRLAMARRAIALSRPGAAGIVADAVGVALGIHAAHEQRPRGNGAAIPV